MTIQPKMIPDVYFSSFWISGGIPHVIQEETMPDQASHNKIVDIPYIIHNGFLSYNFT